MVVSFSVLYQFRKIEKDVGERLSMHRIRVLLAIALTKIGWKDAEIKGHLNWKSFQSLDVYRQGIDLANLRGAKSLAELYENQKLDEQILQWKSSINMK